MAVSNIIDNSCFFFFEGDVEEVYESSKKFTENPHLENLKVCG